MNAETRAYNALGQLTSLTNGGMRFEYDFSPSSVSGAFGASSSIAGWLAKDCKP